MKDKCIEAVSAAIGRKITKAQAEKIEQEILAKLKMHARNDPKGFKSLSEADRLKAAAESIARDRIAEAKRKKEISALAIIAENKIQNYLSTQVEVDKKNPIAALERTLVFNPDMKSNFMSVETRSNAIKSDSIRQIVDVFHSINPRFFGLFENNEGVELITRAIFGEKTGNSQIDKSGELWKSVVDVLKNNFIRLGGSIGDLNDWYVPQHHSQSKVLNSGVEKWKSDILNLLNLEKYVDEKGNLFNAEEMDDFLNASWLSIATGGVNKIDPSSYGKSVGAMLANSRNKSRYIHFKDASSYIEYQKMYGEKTLFGVMTDHIGGLARDISLMETYGPNPERVFNKILNEQVKFHSIKNPEKTNFFLKKERNLKNLYDYVSGKVDPVANNYISKSFDTFRNWQIASKLGSAVITALTDEASMHITARLNNLPEMRLIKNQLASLNPLNKKEKNIIVRAGIGIDTILSELNRFGQENLGASWSSKMATATMRVSGLEALDGARRRAFGATMFSALGEVTRKYKTLSEIDPVDNAILLSKGVSERDFAVWKLAELETWDKGNDVLTPDSIMNIPVEKLLSEGVIERAEEAAGVRREALLKLLGSVLEEVDMAVIRPGLKERFFTSGQFERGTLKGEIARSFFLFKSFPLSVIKRHFMRGISMQSHVGKAAYLASFMAATTVLGAVSQTINDLLSGKNPRNFNPAAEHGVKNWIGALLKGGSLGLYGDFLFSNVTQHSKTGPIASLLGPLAGTIEEVFGVTQGNIVRYLSGDDTSFGAGAVRLMRGNTPLANLWYTKAATDHLIFNNLQEYFTPGYMQKMKKRAEKTYGQTYFWDPDQGISKIRAPDLSRVYQK